MTTNRIISDGNKIIKELAQQYPGEVIQDLKEVESFFEQLMTKTKGLIIVDFLNTDNWDNIKDFKVDHEKGLLYIYWKTPQKESPHEIEMRKSVFPHEVYGFVVKFKQLRFFNIDKHIFFTINGYSVKTKDVKKTMSQNEYTYLDDTKEDFFSVLLLRGKDNMTEQFYFFNTPFFSSLFITKDILIQPQESSQILYLYNVYEAQTRLANVEKALKAITTDDIESLEDQVCSQAVVMRRIMEYTLKLEICYRRVGYTKTIKDYDTLLLGQLINLLKSKKSEDDIQKLNKIRGLSNNLSHDSGKPILKRDADSLFTLVSTYLDSFEKEVFDNNLLILQVD